MLFKEKLFYSGALLLAVFLFLWVPLVTSAASKVVNLYTWSGYIPDAVIQQFERETGIKVNVATYENNEVMYAKLRATPNAGYDVIVPSNLFIDRLRKEGMLEPLDKTQLPEWKNINPNFMRLPFDPKSAYSIAFLWGTTGIFYNTNRYSDKEVHTWSDLWDKRFNNQLMLLDDVRDNFAMALLTLGYSINDKDPEHIKAAFLKLKSLMSNVKVFSTDTVISIIIDEDATIGMAWNGDAFKASQENKNVKFTLPTEGFVIWVDNLAIPKNPPHKDEAHALINFLMRPDIAKRIALFTGYPTANLAGQKLLPAHIRDNPTIYPDKSALRRGQYQVDLGDETLSIYEKYWEQLKMGSGLTN